jgi:branched-chain amino acid transport system permease protein
MRWLFGSFPLYLDIPPLLAGAVDLPGGARYPLYRLAVIGIGIAVAIGLYWLISRTRLGMRIRAGESDREMIGALGVDIRSLYTLVFALGAALAGLAGALVGTPVGAGRHGRAGPDTGFRCHRHWRHRLDQGRAFGCDPGRGRRYAGPPFLPQLFALALGPSQGASAGAAAASMLIYIVMAMILAFRPQGLFAANT